MAYIHFAATTSNDSFATATPIDLSLARIYPDDPFLPSPTLPTFQISAARVGGTIDFYRVELRAGDRITLDIDTFYGELARSLTLFTGNLQFLVSSQGSLGDVGSPPLPGFGATYDPFIAYTVPATGTYYLRVYDDSAPSYRLHIAVASDPLLLSGGVGPDSLTGWYGNDTLTGFDPAVGPDAAGNLLRGLAGHDSLRGGNGADSLDGGTGNDRLRGGGGNDSLLGGEDDDNLLGEGGDDVLGGGAGNDRVLGGTGNDTISGGGGDDALNGGDGDDVVSSLAGPGGGRSALLGGAGADTMYGGGADDQDGGEDDDLLVVVARDDDVLEGSADTEVEGGEGADRLEIRLPELEGVVGLGSIVRHLVDEAGNPFSVFEIGTDLTAPAWRVVFSGIEALTLERDRDGEDGAGRDDWFGLAGDDRLGGGLGVDWIEGRGGADTLFGGLDAPAGTVTDLWARLPLEFLAGGDGDDLIFAVHAAGEADNGLNMLVGDAGNDTLHASQSDTAYGDEDNDRIHVAILGGVAPDGLVDGGAGFDTLVLDAPGGEVAEVVGFRGRPSTLGWELHVLGGPLLLSAVGVERVEVGVSFALQLGGHDSLVGLGSDDLLRGGDGRDTLSGGDGADTLHAGVDMSEGDIQVTELLRGGAGNDLLFVTTGGIGRGDAGDDVLVVGLAGGVVHGGLGNDTLRMDLTFADGPAETEPYSGTAGLIFAGLGTLVEYTSIEAMDLTGTGFADQVAGSFGADTLRGQGGADSIDGRNGDDSILGGLGADTLFGSSGADTLFGGAGSDRLAGGTGEDVLGFLAPGEGVDFLSGFISGEDKVWISRAGFGLAPTDTAVVLTVSATATPVGMAAQFILQGARVWFDADGTGAGARVHVFNLPSTASIAASDFLLG